MSPPDAVYNLSIPDLLRVLNEKLGLECARVRGITLPPAVSASLESEIDDLEARARHTLRFLLSLRNMLRPVNRLPPEIISRIALYSLDKHALDTRSVITLTHVCQYWRQCIISAPENWTLVSSLRMGVATLSLERAKAAHLSIRLWLPHARDYSSLLNVFIPHIRNTETLSITISTSGELATVFSMFPRSIPNLRSLTLDLGDIESWDPSVDPFELVPHTLEDLTLCRIPLSPSLLKLRNLTDLAFDHYEFDLPLDTFLNFLEENHSLKNAVLCICFVEPSLRNSRRQAAIRNQLQLLRIICHDTVDGKALLSGIALSKGAKLEVGYRGYDITRRGVLDILSGTSTTHLSNLLSPTSMEYYAGTERNIQLLGPNGTASFFSDSDPHVPFTEFPQLPLTNIRQFHLDTVGWEPTQASPGPRVFHHLTSFPALETFTVGRETDPLHLLSPLLSNPSSSPSLKTLAFLDCNLSEEFMGELTGFASDRQSTSSAWLHQVLIVHQDGKFPSAKSIHGLRYYVEVVEIRMHDKLPADLA